MKSKEKTSFCQVLTKNSYFWHGSHDAKKLKKKNQIDKPKIIHPKNKIKTQESKKEDQNISSLFKDITFEITCECENQKYSYKGLPFGNENSFQVSFLLSKFIMINLLATM